jgi:UTP:GlnB (protein PII) uridylyltransferase
MATTTEVRDLLRTTSIPSAVVDGLLEDASPIWLMGERADVLAADLALCHPRPHPGEVRAAVRPTSADATWRITVVADDRPGLLASSAGTLAADGLSITRVAASTWITGGLALQSITAIDPAGGERGDEDWERVGDRLRRAIGDGEAPTLPFEPAGPVRVKTMPQRGGRVLVTVRAPDRIGLLATLAEWLAAGGCTIDALRADAVGTMAELRLLIRGAVDAKGLVTHLSGQPPAPAGLDLALGVVGGAIRLGTAPVRAATRAVRRTH